LRCKKERRSVPTGARQYLELLTAQACAGMNIVFDGVPLVGRNHFDVVLALAEQIG
jgi:hypothetical protein